MAGVVDFVFLIDGSGSMGPCMEALKANLGVFLDEICGPQSPVRDWRGRVVAYRDQRADGGGWLEAQPFVQNDVAAMKDQMKGLSARGGGDEPESLLDALHWITQIGQTAASAQAADPEKWRYVSDAVRVVIVFTDATYHEPMTYPEGAGGVFADIQNAIVANRIVLQLYAPDHACYDTLSSIDRADYFAIPGPDFVKGLADLSGDKAKFQQTLLALAKSVSRSAEVTPIA